MLLIAEVAIVLVFDAVVVGRGGGSRGPVDGVPAARGRSCPARSASRSCSRSPSFIGFEATAVFRDEARDPERTIPRATYTALLLIGVFYTLSSWAVVSAWGDAAAVEAGRRRPRRT